MRLAPFASPAAPARPAPGRTAPARPSPSRPAAAPEVDTVVEERVQLPWRVLLFNDEIHTFDEVIGQLVKATGCTFEHAQGVAWTVHTEGKAVAYEGSFEACFRVQGVLREIGLVTQIEG